MQAAGYPAMNAAAPFALRRSFDWKWVVIGLCVVFTIYIAVVPLAFSLWQSFFTPQTAAKAAEFTLGNYTSAYGSSETLRLFWNSVQFAVGASVFAFVLGTGLAWMNERTNTPFKTLFFALSIIPLIIPGILFTVAWILLGSPKIGIINLALQNWFGLEQPLFNVYSLWGMIWVDGLHYSPMAFLLMTAAFRAMDPALEESATMSGANIFQVAYRVTLKLTWPAILATLLMLFVRAIESFEVPALLGLPVGIHVFTSAIYQAVHRYPSQIGLDRAHEEHQQRREDRRPGELQGHPVRDLKDVRPAHGRGFLERWVHRAESGRHQEKGHRRVVQAVDPDHPPQRIDVEQGLFQPEPVLKREVDDSDLGAAEQDPRDGKQNPRDDKRNDRQGEEERLERRIGALVHPREPRPQDESEDRRPHRELHRVPEEAQRL